MNRRDLLKTLAMLPVVGMVKAEEPPVWKSSKYRLSEGQILPLDRTGYSEPCEVNTWVFYAHYVKDGTRVVQDGWTVARKR